MIRWIYSRETKIYSSIDGWIRFEIRKTSMKEFRLTFQLTEMFCKRLKTAKKIAEFIEAEL